MRTVKKQQPVFRYNFDILFWCLHKFCALPLFTQILGPDRHTPDTSALPSGQMLHTHLVRGSLMINLRMGPWTHVTDEEREVLQQFAVSKYHTLGSLNNGN